MMRLLAFFQVRLFLLNNGKAVLIFLHQEFLVCGCVSVMKMGVSVLDNANVKESPEPCAPNNWALFSQICEGFYHLSAAATFASH